MDLHDPACSEDAAARMPSKVGSLQTSVPSSTLPRNMKMCCHAFNHPYAACREISGWDDTVLESPAKSKWRRDTSGTHQRLPAEDAGQLNTSRCAVEVQCGAGACQWLQLETAYG